MSRVPSMKTARNNAHVSNACVSCRERKTKCDGGKPVCSSCNKKGRECAWLVDSDRRTTRGRKCEDCVSWRTGYAELEARLAEKDARLVQTEERLAQTEARLAQILNETALGLRALRAPQDALAMAEPSPTALEAAAERRLSFQEPLFPLHKAIAESYPHLESFMHEHCIDSTYWLPASASPAFLDGSTDLDALYGGLFAPVEPSIAPGDYAQVERLSGDAKQ